MTTKYRVVGRQDHRDKRSLGVYNVPDAALWLNEDIMRIEWMIMLAKQIDPRNITASETPEQREFGDTMLRSQIVLMQTWVRHARKVLAKDFLAK